VAAKKALPHGDFLHMAKEQLPFGKRKAEMLMAIARDSRLRNVQNFALLPPSLPALYDISRLNDGPLAEAFADGTISPDMERGKISGRVKAEKRAAKESDLGKEQLDDPEGRFGIIVTDNEWRFEPWSRSTGMDRAADNHYSTTETALLLQGRAALIRKIAADDCVLFCWATVPMLREGLAFMEACGFEYKSHFIWFKDKAGTGYWNRNRHELLLVGTKGNVPAPAMGTQPHSVIQVPVGKHYAKPEIFLEMIEQYFPTLPKIELNRRGAARPGWRAWGNELAAAESNLNQVVNHESTPRTLGAAERICAILSVKIGPRLCSRPSGGRGRQGRRLYRHFDCTQCAALGTGWADKGVNRRTRPPFAAAVNQGGRGESHGDDRDGQGRTVENCARRNRFGHGETGRQNQCC
jgi:N6-adenosine-specific RNA methylase IME4